MKKWYRAGLTKGILVLLQHVLVAVMIISMLWIVTYPGVTEDMLSGEKLKNYGDSKGFGQQMFMDSQSILQKISEKDMLETDGKLDKTRIVDIKEYADNSTISDKDVNGLAYTLGDLEKWNDDLENGITEWEDSGVDATDPIVVCKKPDGSYEYYYYSTFSKMLEDGDLAFVMDDTGITSSNLQDSLHDGSLAEGYYAADFSGIKNREDRIQYVDCWNYDGYWMEERFLTVSGDSILQIVNENPEWNGKLNKAFSELQEAISDLSVRIDNYEDNGTRWQEGNTNLTYLYADLSAKKVYTNNSEFESFDQVSKNIEKLKKTGKYVVVEPKLKDFDSNIDGVSAEDWRTETKLLGTSEDNFIYCAAVDTTYAIQDPYYSQNQMYSRYAPAIRSVVGFGAASIVAFLGIMVWLTVIAGKKSEDEEIHLNWFDRWKTELAVAVIFGAWFAAMFVVVSVGNDYAISTDIGYNSYGTISYASTYNTDMLNNIPQTIAGIVGGVFSCAMFLIGYLSLVRRIKAKSLWKNSLVRWLIHFFGQVFHNIHATWKTILLFFGFLLVHWIALSSGSSGPWILFMLVVEAVVGIWLVRNAIGRQRIRTGIERIAKGEVNYKIRLDGLKGDQLDIAQRINTIGEGLDAAVEASMKNERLKTDLITNVSHDIKTPLTSIINYVDLLKRENFDDPKIQGYLDILENKAQRLKTLTEDVVEASKVSSGNITLEYMNINLVEMIQQTSGEFEEKFSKRHLQEVLTLPDEEAVVHVDGRRMWRILENIYNNAAKYAMEGTRVYADLKTTDTTVVFMLKNVSEQPLNITADELTERFIRGDVSRSTEGSGLGLSIAKSLTDMQGGTFELYLDGDLFRVTITFPRMIKVMNPEPEL